MEIKIRRLVDVFLNWSLGLVVSLGIAAKLPSIYPWFPTDVLVPFAGILFGVWISAWVSAAILGKDLLLVGKSSKVELPIIKGVKSNAASSSRVESNTRTNAPARRNRSRNK